MTHEGDNIFSLILLYWYKIIIYINVSVSDYYGSVIVLHSRCVHKYVTIGYLHAYISTYDSMDLIM